MQNIEETNDQRCLHLVVFNPFECVIAMAKVFDTYKSSQELEQYIDQIPAHSIIVAACKDECVTNLSEKCK